MDRSPEINELVTALIAAQSSVATIVKDSKNDFIRKRGGEAHRYASLETVLDCINPALHSNGLSLTQWPDGDGLVNLLAHSSGQFISSVYPIARVAKQQKVEKTGELREIPDDPQSRGSAITYARRYSALAIMGVGTEDDDGHAASTIPSKATPAPAAPAKAAKPKKADTQPHPEEFAALRAACREQGITTLPAFTTLVRSHCSDLADPGALTLDEINTLMAALKEAKQKGD